MRLSPILKALKKILLALIGIAFVLGAAPLALYIVGNDVVIFAFVSALYEKEIVSSHVINAHGDCISVDANMNVDPEPPYHTVVTLYAVDRWFSTDLVTVTSSRLQMDAKWIDNTHIKIVANLDDGASISRPVEDVGPIHIDYSFGHTFVDAVEHTFEIGDVAISHSGPNDCGPAFAPEVSPLDKEKGSPFPIVPP